MKLLVIFVLFSIFTFPQEQAYVFAFQPEWSPNGQEIAFVASYDDNLDIWVMEADASNLRNLTADNISYSQEPTWSPDGLHIAYSSDTTGDNFNYDVIVMDKNGENSVNLTQGSENYDAQPAWSPDGQYIAYISATREFGIFGGDVWVVNVTTLEKENLTADSPDVFSTAQWSLDGKKILATAHNFTPDKDEINLGAEIKEIKSNGLWLIDDTLQQISKSSFFGGVWSPDGKTIIASDETNLFTLSGEKFEATQLTDFPNNKYWPINPVWSPDSQKIAFSYGEASIGQISIIHLIDKQIESFSVNNVNVESGIVQGMNWSPDGKQIAFGLLVSGTNRSDIWVIDADGTNLKNLTGDYYR